MIAVEDNGPIANVAALVEADNDSGDVPADVDSDQVDPSQYLNEAEIRGEFTPGLKALLEQPVVYMTGSLWDQGDHRNTKDSEWKRNEMKWGAFLTHPKSPLTNHPTAKYNQGASIVLA